LFFAELLSVLILGLQAEGAVLELGPWFLFKYDEFCSASRLEIEEHSVIMLTLVLSSFEDEGEECPGCNSAAAAMAVSSST